MHADNGSVDHLDSSIPGSGKRFYDAAPNTGPPPPDEAVVASSVRAKRRRQITPGCSRSEDLEDAIQDRLSFTRATPRALFGSNGLMADHS